MPTLRQKVIERLSIGGLDQCWEWQGARSNGYGCLHNPETGGRQGLVHRYVYELWRGPIPEGLTIDHLCRNRACANPHHLEPVTRGENVMRGDTIPARNKKKTHCIHGHEFSKENTLVSGRVRYCRTCMRRRAKEKVERDRWPEDEWDYGTLYNLYS